jgi:RimJ/RimL family protein N-acetyltransferase
VLFNRSFGGIGYVVGAAHRGQRLAVRALQVMTDYAHQAAAMPRVQLEIEPDNHPSVAVARAAGFHLTDAAPEMVEDKGRSYALLTWAHDAPGGGRGPAGAAAGELFRAEDSVRTVSARGDTYGPHGC